MGSSCRSLLRGVSEAARPYWRVHGEVFCKDLATADAEAEAGFAQAGSSGQSHSCGFLFFLLQEEAAASKQRLTQRRATLGGARLQDT